MNDYFSCTKNNGSLKSNRKLLAIKHLQSNTGDNLVQVKYGSWTPHNLVHGHHIEDSDNVGNRQPA